MTETGYTKSKYQIDINRQYTQSLNNILVGAVAGSGKSTTLLDLLQNTFVPCTFLAFNKSIAEEIKTKVGYNPVVDIMTLHSLGMKSMLRHYNHQFKVQVNKIWLIAKQFEAVWKIDKTKYAGTIMRLQRLVDIYRLTLCQDIDQLQEVADRLGIDYQAGDLLKAIDLVRGYAVYNKNPEIIDFTDMIYIPATNPDIKLFGNPKVVFVDECQDLNKCQHALLDKLIKQGSARFVACGDPYQSIYSFAGADSESFNLFKSKPNTIQLPLSICYRCPSAVIDEANEVYDILEKFDGAGEGIVREGYTMDIREGDMVICRNLKPLIHLYFELIADGNKAIIRGKDIGEGLITFIKPYEHTRIPQLLQELNTRLMSKYKELEDRGIEKPANHPSFISVDEKVEVIKVISDQFHTTNQLIDFLQKMFGDDDREGVILSTIHKSKGLENPRVFILNKHLIPSKYASSDEQLKQEDNLLYVAITRAQEELIYINKNY